MPNPEPHKEYPLAPIHARGLLAGKQLRREGQADHEPATHTCDKGGQQTAALRRTLTADQER